MAIETEYIGMATAEEMTRLDVLISNGGKRTLFQKGGSSGTTLPKPLLDEYNLNAGDEILIVPMDDDQAVCKIVPVPE